MSPSTSTWVRARPRGSLDRCFRSRWGGERTGPRCDEYRAGGRWRRLEGKVAVITGGASGIRLSGRPRSLLWILAWTLAVGAGCGSEGQASLENYIVSAPVVAVAGGPAKACAGIPLSSSPGDCGGVELDGIDIHAIKGITIYPNGTVETPVLRLAGKWDGRRLMLTSSPVVIDNSAVTRLPDCANGASQPSPALSQIQAAMQQDRQVLTSRGILVLKTAPCVDHLLVVELTRLRGHLDTWDHESHKEAHYAPEVHPGVPARVPC